MRLIDADALIEKCYKQMDELMESTSEHLSAEALSLLCGFTLINSAPTIEPKRGEWEEKEIFGEYDDDVHHYVSEWQSARCSVCGKYHTTPYAYYFDEYNFCPNCGADMRKESE